MEYRKQHANPENTEPTKGPEDTEEATMGHATDTDTEKTTTTNVANGLQSDVQCRRPDHRGREKIIGQDGKSEDTGKNGPDAEEYVQRCPGWHWV